MIRRRQLFQDKDVLVCISKTRDFICFVQSLYRLTCCHSNSWGHSLSAVRCIFAYSDIDYDIVEHLDLSSLVASQNHCCCLLKQYILTFNFLPPLPLLSCMNWMETQREKSFWMTSSASCKKEVCACARVDVLNTVPIYLTHQGTHHSVCYLVSPLCQRQVFNSWIYREDDRPPPVLLWHMTQLCLLVFH